MEAFFFFRNSMRDLHQFIIIKKKKKQTKIETLKIFKREKKIVMGKIDENLGDDIPFFFRFFRYFFLSAGQAFVCCNLIMMEFFFCYLIKELL